MYKLFARLGMISLLLACIFFFSIFPFPIYEDENFVIDLTLSTLSMIFSVLTAVFVRIAYNRDELKNNDFYYGMALFFFSFSAMLFGLTIYFFEW